MNVAVFSRIDITPEQWRDFATAADSSGFTPAGQVVAPYILVSSVDRGGGETAESAVASRAHATVVKLESGSPAFFEYCSRFEDLVADHAETGLSKYYSQFFVILDSHAFRDRTARLVWRKYEWRDSDGKVDRGGPAGRDDLMEVKTWRCYDIRLEYVFRVSSLIDTKGFAGDEFDDRVVIVDG